MGMRPAHSKNGLPVGNGTGGQNCAMARVMHAVQPYPIPVLAVGHAGVTWIQIVIDVRPGVSLQVDLSSIDVFYVKVRIPVGRHNPCGVCSGVWPDIFVSGCPIRQQGLDAQLPFHRSISVCIAVPICRIVTGFESVGSHKLKVLAAIIHRGNFKLLLVQRPPGPAKRMWGVGLGWSGVLRGSQVGCAGGEGGSALKCHEAHRTAACRTDALGAPAK